MREINADVLIIGAGPAGLSAAIYTARACKKTVVLKGKTKSHLELAHKVENYPGIDSITGHELLKRFEDQATKFGAEIVEADALDLALEFEPKMVTTRAEFIQSKVVILALGKGEHKKDIIGESDFLGAGVSYCATCDGDFYKGKKVVVYGNDFEAVHDAQMLTQLGCDVTLVSYCKDKSCPDSLLKLAQERGVHLLHDTEIVEVMGSGTVEKVRIKNNEGERELEASGLFIIQAIPSSALLSKIGVTLSTKDCISVDREMKTNFPGVFAAGDITCGGWQISIANGEGSSAALSALKYLRDHQ